MTRRYSVLDVFTRTALAGNPLAVVHDTDGLDTVAMQTIAREFGLPETVFVFPAANPTHTAKLRIFTPGRELDFAGHPTVGTAVLLASRRFANLSDPIDAMIVLEENVGIVRSAVKLEPQGASYAEFTVPKVPAPVAARFGDKSAIADALGLTSADIGFENHKPGAWSCGSPFLFVPIAGLEPMRRARPRLDGFKDAFGTVDRVGVYLYTRECVHHDSHFHARMFAPESGIYEDPATGSAVAAFGGTLLTQDDLADGTHNFRVEQGLEMGRASFMDLGIDVADATIKAERIGGHAVIIAEGTLFV
jgi:trans-2,3-dihydro-3-hydroxyanthranilate isomerase